MRSWLLALALLGCVACSRGGAKRDERRLGPLLPVDVPTAKGSAKPYARGVKAPVWTGPTRGAAVVANEPVLFGMGEYDEGGGGEDVKFARARAFHELDYTWRAFIRRLNLELYGADPNAKALPLPPWVGTGTPRDGVTFPLTKREGGNVIVRAEVRLDTMLARYPQGSDKSVRAAAMRVHALFVQRARGEEVDADAPSLVGTDVSMGGCAVGREGEVWCWADGDAGVLPDGAPRVPRRVVGVPKTRSVTSRFGTTCAVTVEGALYCWGAAGSGQVPGASERHEPDALATRWASTPTRIALTRVAQVSLSQSHVCARDEDGRVSCWGGNASGELGYPAKPPAAARIVDQPVAVRLPEPARQVVAGVGYSCAVGVSGHVLCWGAGDPANATCRRTGQACDGMHEVANVTNARSVADLGDGTTCALLEDGTVDCWGAAPPSDGGDPPPCDASRPCPPTRVAGLSGVTQLTPSCALLRSGEMSCWGRRAGASRSPRRFALPGGASAVQIDSSVLGDACARTADGAVYCWGPNAYDAFGDSLPFPVLTPLRLHFAATPEARK